MTFDINEARAIIEDAKKRGLIGTAEAGSGKQPAASPRPVTDAAKDVVLPDWLQEGIKQGPLVRTETSPTNERR